MSEKAVDNLKTKRIHAHVYGEVQRVGFRQATCNKARQLGLNGYVRNMPEGHVEAWAEGPTDKIDKFLDWLQQGPAAANVSRVDLGSTSPHELPATFMIAGGPAL